MSDRHSDRNLESKKKRTVLKTLAGTGASALTLPGLASAGGDPNGHSGPNSNQKSSEDEFEKLKELDYKERDRVLEDKFGDDISEKELQKEFGDALEFEDDRVSTLTDEVSKTLSVPGLKDAYVTITLGDWEIGFEVSIQGVIFVETTIGDVCNDSGKVCGDILFADGCTEYTYSREEEYFEYEIDGKYWAGTWSDINVSDKVDLSDEFDELNEDWSSRCN